MIVPNLSNTALFKYIVYFHDDKSRTFYSLDRGHKRAKPNKALGILRLEKILMIRFRGTWETTIIYENLPKGKEVTKYKNSIRVL